MSNTLVQTVGFSIVSLEDFESKHLATNVLSAFLNAADPFRPRQFGVYDADQIIESANGPIGTWLNEPLNERNTARLNWRAGQLALKSSICEYQIAWSKRETPSFQSITGNVPISSLKSSPPLLESFVKLFQVISIEANAIYGQMVNESFAGWNTPFDFCKRLPDTPWLGIYGQPYVDMFGQDKFESAPAWRVERLRPRIYLLQATETLFAAISNEVKIGIKSHFGHEAFMEPMRWKYSSGVAPNFDFSKVISKRLDE